MSSTEPVIDPRIERTRRVVVDAAVELLATEGAARVTIDAIAERSGVARSTIYRHWPDRADLYAEAFAVVCDVGEMPDVGSLVAELRFRALNLANGLCNEAWGRMLPAIVGGADHDADLRSALASFTAMRRDEALGVLRRAVERGEIDDDGDFDAVLERFIAPFFFRRMMTAQPLDEALVECQLRALCDEIGATYTPRQSS